MVTLPGEGPPEVVPGLDGGTVVGELGLAPVPADAPPGGPAGASVVEVVVAEPGAVEPLGEVVVVVVVVVVVGVVVVVVVVVVVGVVVVAVVVVAVVVLPLALWADVDPPAQPATRTPLMTSGQTQLLRIG